MILERVFSLFQRLWNYGIENVARINLLKIEFVCFFFLAISHIAILIQLPSCDEIK